MRAYFLIPCAALALAACNDRAADDAALNADANTMMVDNMGADANNMMAAPGGADANMATNTTEEMNTDLTTNDADTNLANGM